MRKLHLIIHILLLVTTPALLAYPPVQTVSHKKLHKNFHKEKRYSRLTYDQILSLLDEIETGKAEKKYKKEEIKQINYFLAYLANKGELSNKEHPLALQEDIQDLLSDDFEYAYALGDEEYTIIPAIYDELIDFEFYQSGFFSHPWKKTKKFVKNHKKEIIIGAIIVVAVTVVIVTIVAAPTAGAAVAAAASGAASSQLSTSSELPEAPRLEAALDQETTALKRELDAESFFQPLSSEQLSMEETGRALLPLFAQESYNRLQCEISTQPQLAQEVQTFSPTFAPANRSPTNFQAASYQARGEKALNSGYYDQATQDFTKSLELDPANSLPYLERSMAYFHKEDYDHSLQDFHQYQSQIPAPIAFSTAEFGLGFAKGLPQGIYESGESILILLTDIMTSPLHTGQQMFESLSLLSQLARTQEWGLVAEAFAPEVRELVTQWDTLPSETRGELAGYALGKYGADLVIPGAVGKAIAKGLKGTQELSTVYRGLKNAEKTLLLETASEIGNSAKITEVMRTGKTTVALSEDLGLTPHEMALLKKSGKLESTINSKFEKLVCQSESEVLKNAINQNKHTKMVRDYLDKPTKEIQKGINSYEKQIAIHKDKMTDPKKYYPNWEKLDPRQREALVSKKWPVEIKGYEEQRDLLQSILCERLCHEH